MLPLTLCSKIEMIESELDGEPPQVRLYLWKADMVRPLASPASTCRAV